ncbi:TetR/AcrR family transcriptional regulator [Rhodococcus sp. NPDC056960]|uniref:TetR/AcrR family transcriptional regulator n=1 Tax=Rhodococcus sp. NPDC056960 TaxID=3345982 RepID=UPI003628DD7F
MSAKRTNGARSTRRRELILSELLDTATELFAAKGYEATSLQDIADAMDVSRSALYHYLGTKDDLLAMLVEQVSRSLAEVLEELRTRPDLSPVDKVRNLTELLVRQRAEHPSQFRILDRSETVLPEPAGTEHLEAKRRIVRELVNIIDEGVKIGQFRPVDSRTAAFSLLGMCNWVAWWFRPQDASDIDAVVATITRLAQDMLCGPQEEAEVGSIGLLNEIRDRLDRLEPRL